MIVKRLKLWLIYQTAISGYDVYDSAVVVAADKKSAKKIHPMQIAKTFREDLPIKIVGGKFVFENGRPIGDCWPSNVKDVKAKCLGVANKKLSAGKVICVSMGEESQK